MYVTERKVEQVAIDAAGRRERARIFDVIAESQDDALEVLRAAKNVHNGSVFVNHQGIAPDSHLACVALEVTSRIEAPVAGTGLYQIVAHYAYPDATSRSAAPAAIWYMERSTSSEPVDIDADGYIIQNSSLEPIDPPFTAYMISRSLVGAFHVQYQSHWSAYNALKKYENKVNSEPFKGFAPKCLLCEYIQVRETYVWYGDTGATHLRVNTSMLIKDEKTIGGVTYGGFVAVFPDRGMRYAHWEQGQFAGWIQINTSEPQYLDGHANILPYGHDPVYVPINLYRSIDFNEDLNR